MNPKIKDLWLKGRDDEKDIRKKIEQELESRYRILKGTS